MSRHEEFLERHKNFIESVQEYASEHKLDYAVMIGDDHDAVLPWSIKRAQNSQIMIETIENVQESAEGTLHCEHHTSQKEFDGRIKEIDADEVEIHETVVRH